MDTEQPLVSICVANYNGVGVLEACLQSIFAQDCNFAWEVLMHDDASTDDSVAWVAANYPQVRVISSRENAGFCVSNNKMAAAARGSYLLLLNNDAELFPDALRTLLPGTGGLGAQGIFGLPQFDAVTGKLLDRGSLLDPFFNPVPNDNPERTEVGMIMGACLWIPKMLWDEVGGFPEWFGSIGEDLYLCCLARLWGYPVRVMSVSGYRHHVGRSFGGGKVTRDNRLVSTFRRRRRSECNKTFVLMMLTPMPFVLVLLPVHLLLLAIEGALLVVLRLQIRYWTEIYWPVFVELWRRRHFLWSRRQAVMMQRKCGPWDFFRVFQLWPYKWCMLVRYGLPELK